MIATLAHPKVVPGDTRSVAQLDGAVSGPDREYGRGAWISQI